MYVTIVHVKVKPANVDEFIAASEKNHLQSVKEPGNLRFDVLQKGEDPTEFALYEAYTDQASSAAHKETAHYLEWRETVASWMAEPRKGIPYKGLLP
ncbi:MAG: antibiotic biosynthesis monooxygenase [Bacteroides sp.]|nr:antibiotic biosynthesis monooxygenase [Bacteroides sp.]